MNKSTILTLTLVLAAIGFGVTGASSRSTSAAEAAIGEKSLQTPPSQSQSLDKSNDGLTTEAVSEFSNGGKSLGRGFVNGTRVTEHAFKKAGTTMVTSFKKVGRTIHDYFTGNSAPEVQENDLGSAISSRGETSQKLDAVGNELPNKPAGNSKLD